MPAKRTSKSTTNSGETGQPSRTEKLEQMAGSIATKAKDALSGIGHAIADHMPGHDTRKSARKAAGTGAKKSSGTGAKTAVKKVSTTVARKVSNVAKVAKKAVPAKGAKKAGTKSAGKKSAGKKSAGKGAK